LIPVIDLFAGPGGLNEGFSRLGEDEGRPAFTTVGSFEMETSACSTLRLRGAYRHLKRRPQGVPSDYYKFIRGQISWDDFSAVPEIDEALRESDSHIYQIELGVDRDSADALIRARLAASGVTDEASPWVLIGGPPCQAYSLAGRSRRANDAEFVNDKKHFLYREYLHIIETFAPPVFVMENVKGLLSSTHSGTGMFERIKNDLMSPGNGLEYDIFSLKSDLAATELQPADFVLHAEDYGVPQKRHRVILVGVRRGFFHESARVKTLEAHPTVSVREALRGLPALRSGISPARDDGWVEWSQIRAEIESSQVSDHEFTSSEAELDRGGPFIRTHQSDPSTRFEYWVTDAAIAGVVQHESRSHMVKDLKRYWFAANQARHTGVSPRLGDFPIELQPNHRNASSASRPFEDRFRVQVMDKPSTTVVSHISKDGHYYIHPDPSQMRSLTVREAARLQSFPDNYFFMGNRTQQYHQVGNAVPPLLAHQIAEAVFTLFEERKIGSLFDRALALAI
jgi:DNA (cytosine-5)-methyltransferase 1